MNSLHRVLLGIFVLATFSLTSLALADSKLDITNWKELLPEAVYAKLVEDSAKNLASYCASASQFNQNGRKIQAEATNVIVYAEIARRGGNANAGALRKVAEDLLEAAKAKKAEDSKKLAADIAGFRTLSGAKGDDLDFVKGTTLKTIMDVTVKELDREITKYKRMTTPVFNAKGKPEEVMHAMYKIAALSVPTTAHAPTTDLPKGKTTKDWLAASEEMRKHALEAANAAKNKKLPELKTAVNNLSASCAKCHDDFRVEIN